MNVETKILVLPCFRLCSLKCSIKVCVTCLIHREDLWERNNYSSSNITLDSDDEDDEEEEGELLEDHEDEERRLAIQYVKGDVTYPDVKKGDSIVVHCVG